MTRTVKRQPYHSPRRREQAAATRRAVVEVALRRFLDDGYAATTMAAVASDAGVSVETVYKGFGNKPGLLKAIYDAAVAGDDLPLPVAARTSTQQVLADPDPKRLLMRFSEHVASTGERTGPLLLAIRSAAAADDGARAVWEQVQQERLRGMSIIADRLGERGALRPDVTGEEARDVLWTYTALDLWDLLVNQRRWGTPRFGHWIGHQLVAALL